jgi:peptide/nickel transport system ATP-binding protein/oligopeptide transport system ATP-binding protein
MDQYRHLLDVQNLKTYFFTPEGVARAVDDISFHIDSGETLGLVGESGCGKSVTALSIMRLLNPKVGRTVGGSIHFKGQNLLDVPPLQMRSIRGGQIAMIFQEPMTSLNPVYTVGDQIAESLTIHENMGAKEAWAKAEEMLNKVQIPSPRKRAREYPHQLSGGMRQRAMIAMALACSPAILIADEPTTALDVTIQAQIIDLMIELKQDYNAAIMMITHDLGVIAEMAQRVAVMYAGQIVEEAPALDLFEKPRHPYTLGLLGSVPILGERAEKGRQRLREIQGIVPSLYELPTGCKFHPRCPDHEDLCLETHPDLIDLGDGHRVRCHLAHKEKAAA